MSKLKPIGIFDSGYGGLTVLKEIKNLLPNYDYLYLGDNARAPYGPRSFDTVYHYTKQCVQWLFAQNCELIILACNTASAKALRTIQQKDLAGQFSHKRVLGVIRPTAEIIGSFSHTNHIGILGTDGTVRSGSYLLEIEKFFPGVSIWQQACPLWVPLVENNEFDNQGGEYFIKKEIESLLSQSDQIDTILLGCTHYPLLIDTIKKFLPKDVNIISQGNIVAKSLQDYLYHHPEMDKKCSKHASLRFCTTDSIDDFNKHARAFYGEKINAEFIIL
ncbi:MAG: glutamate racemase [Ginsengibacter sp.]